jgi:acyl carrier protein phosphodiesterase
MLGGIVADFARNPEIEALPRDVQEGVRLHRAIDGFTDRHPMVQRSVGRISASAGWFASIVIDIYYDHILARTWQRYNLEPLGHFSARAYHSLQRQLPTAPIAAQLFLQQFIKRDLIGEYATLEGITRTLARVSEKIAQRIPKRALWLPDLVPELRAREERLEEDFRSFYPELMTFAARFLRDFSGAGSTHVC